MVKHECTYSLQTYYVTISYTACREEFAIMLFTSSKDLCQWLKLTCEDILCTCGGRAYISQEAVVKALHTVLRVYRLLESVPVHADSRQFIEDMVRKCNESVSDYIMRLITLVSRALIENFIGSKLLTSFESDLTFALSEIEVEN